MDLGEEERYAVAALFTLALHASQYDNNTGQETWGEPAAVERDPRTISEVGETELDAWWGYDLSAPGGLLDRIYREMQLPATKWRGLKALPGAAPSAGDNFFRQMVRGLIGMLDADLAAALPPLAPRPTPSRLGCTGSADSPLSPSRRDVPDHLFEGLIDSGSEDDDACEDEDWVADLAREKKLQASAERKRPTQTTLRHQLSAEVEGAVMRISRRLSGGLSLGSEASWEEGQEGAQHQQQDVGHLRQYHQLQEQNDGSRTGEQQQEQEQAGGQMQQASFIDPLGGLGSSSTSEQVLCDAAGEPATPPRPKQQQRQQEVQEGLSEEVPQVPPEQGQGPPLASPKAMGAVWELVQCCVGAVPTPPRPSSPKLPRPAAVRWYDARARVALLQVAAWLQVPPRKVCNLELLLTHGGRAPRHTSLSGLEKDAWERRMRYLKVGAAAVGGGALFAVTGGLAAPAIAAGVGSILGFIGTPTAIAGTVTGFLASTAGAATVTTTMAASGAASTGTRMAYRTAEVSEFGFRELLPVQQQAKQQGRRQQGPPTEQELRQLPSARDQATVAAPAAEISGVPPSTTSDPGHLGFGCGNYPSSRAQALCRASSGSFKHSGNSSSSSLKGDRSSVEGGQPQTQQEVAPQGEQQSAWQRLFGGGSSGSKKEEELLLPVPMRAKRSGDVKLSVSVYVAGWITQRSDFEQTWQSCVNTSDADCFTLVWETHVLLHLNSALGKLLTMQAAGQGLQLATHSFFYAGAGLVAALGPTVLLGTASGLLISNAWAVVSDRAVKAGKVLAHLLLSGAHGDRPVTLVSHGMGARLVFHCLLELCRQGARGVVQHAVLMGAPVGTEGVRWRMARRAVAGRLVNCYTRKDWLLGVCAGGSSGWMTATAGLVPIEGVAGVENVDLSGLVEGHLAYLEEFDSIMDMLML